MSVAPFTTEELNAGAEALLAEGGQFSVMPMEVRGVAYPRVFALSSMSLRDVLAVKTAEHADKTLTVYEGERMTVGECWAKAMRLANWLHGQGYGPGDRIGLAMRNYPEWLVAYLGVIASGACVVPLNAWWQEEELSRGIERAGIRLVVVDAKRAERLAAAKGRLGLVFIGAREEVESADHRLEAIMSDEALSVSPPPVPIDPESDFSLLFTSGSTGEPKGALLTHRSIVNAILSWAFQLELFQRLRPEHEFVPENPGILLSLPLFHVTAAHSVALLSYLTGRKIAFMYRWDAKEAAKLIRKEKLTNFLCVPTMSHELVEAAGPGDLDTLVDITTGGAKRPETQRQNQREIVPDVGASSGYGLTETNALGCHITLTDYDRRPSSTGRAIMPVMEIAAFTEEGERLPVSKIGEICMRSPANFRGYLDDEEATAAAFHPDGWFRTGDVGYVDQEGFVFIVDRLKDLIIRGGENVSCLEVENALLAQDRVDEASVFAVPDEVMGERVGAVVWSASGPLDLGTVRGGAAAHLAAFKVPERMWLAPSQLPRGKTGKIDKGVIRTLAANAEPDWSV